MGVIIEDPRFPSKEEIVEILLNTAKAAVWDQNLTHPEDIANALTTAIEYGAITIVEYADHLSGRKQ